MDFSALSTFLLMLAYISFPGLLKLFLDLSVSVGGGFFFQMSFKKNFKKIKEKYAFYIRYVEEKGKKED